MEKVRKRKKLGVVLLNEETGEKFYFPGYENGEHVDLTETDLSVAFEELFRIIDCESYLLFFSYRDNPNLMIKTLPDQMRDMLLPHLVQNPDLLEMFMDITTEAIGIFKEGAEKITIQ